jgi:TonB family protein
MRKTAASLRVMKQALMLCIVVLLCTLSTYISFPTAEAASSHPATQEKSSTVPEGGKNGYTNPKCERCPIPAYTDQAFRARIEGTVMLSAVVSKDGQAHHITVTKSLGYGLDEKTVKTVRDEWRFQPATGPDGKPAAVRIPIEVDFHIH